MANRSIFYRKKGETVWNRCVGPATGFRIDQLPSEVKYEVDIGDGELKEIVTLLPAVGTEWSPKLFPTLQVIRAYPEEMLDAGFTEGAGYEPTMFSDTSFEQSDVARRPVVNTDGIHFSTASKDILVYKGMGAVAPSLTRWGIGIFRVNDTAMSKRANIGTMMGGGSSNRYAPAVQYTNGKMQVIWGAFSATTDTEGQFIDAQRATIKIDCDGAITDGQTWNIGTFGRHNGKTYARLNGNPHTNHTHPDYRYSYTGESEAINYIGVTNSDTCDISLNCLIFGQGEVSEKFIRKL
ncbi:hypothetical protein, partial [uncultured Croceicoccus sp.]|uniref:hypothetical protein n=1 Tax=uncultured Croceicoccus sp. TaxID=1295329 RepID=UPI0026046EBF